MKKLILSLLLIATIQSLFAQNNGTGTTTALWSAPTAKDFTQAKALGVEYVEVALNQCYRNIPSDQVSTRINAMKAAIDSAGIKVWSMHLPFSRTLDISVTDSAKRAENVQIIAHMIEQSAMFKPSRLVLHPSSEPIADSMRAVRISNARASIKYLNGFAKKIGAQLCIENLPRTCLGNTPEELLQIMGDMPEVGICFDTNHYVDTIRYHTAVMEHFMEVAGHRVRTIHASDYDFVNECHWLPTQGGIDWTRFMKELQTKGYKGVFMFEATKNQGTKTRLTIDQIAGSFHTMKANYQNTK